MSFIGLAHIGIYTKDLNKSKQFYMDNLGFRLLTETCIKEANLTIAMLKLNGLSIELLEPMGEIANQDGIIEHFAIEVSDIKEVVNNLKNKGIEFFTDEPIENKILFNGIKFIFMKGPNGEKIELIEYLKN